MSDFKPEAVIWSKLHVHSEKLPQLGEKQRRMAKILRHVRN